MDKSISWTDEHPELNKKYPALISWYSSLSHDSVNWNYKWKWQSESMCYFKYHFQSNYKKTFKTKEKITNEAII